MRVRLPCTMWLRFSFVLTCTVKSQLRSASAVFSPARAAADVAVGAITLRSLPQRLEALGLLLPPRHYLIAAN